MNVVCTTPFLPVWDGNHIVTSAQLTSNVERGGSHLTCPGQVVVLTCSETGTALLLWTSVFFPDITYTANDEKGKEEVVQVGMNTFTNSYGRLRGKHDLHNDVHIY